MKKTVKRIVSRLGYEIRKTKYIHEQEIVTATSNLAACAINHYTNGKGCEILEKSSIPCVDSNFNHKHCDVDGFINERLSGLNYVVITLGSDVPNHIEIIVDHVIASGFSGYLIIDFNLINFLTACGAHCQSIHTEFLEDCQSKINELLSARGLKKQFYFSSPKKEVYVYKFRQGLPDDVIIELDGDHFVSREGVCTHIKDLEGLMVEREKCYGEFFMRDVNDYDIKFRI